MTIDGRVEAITGGSSGIGEATADLLVQRGAWLVLGVRGAEKLEAVAAWPSAAGADVVAAVTDVSRREDVANVVALATETCGRLDFLVSNAGAFPGSLTVHEPTAATPGDPGLAGGRAQSLAHDDLERL